MGVGERRKANGRNDFEENRDCIAYHIKGVLHAALMILKLLCVGLKLFLLLFAVIVRVVLSLIGIAARD